MHFPLSHRNDGRTQPPPLNGKYFPWKIDASRRIFLCRKRPTGHTQTDWWGMEDNYFMPKHREMSAEGKKSLFLAWQPKKLSSISPVHKKTRDLPLKHTSKEACPSRFVMRSWIGQTGSRCYSYVFPHKMMEVPCNRKYPYFLQAGWAFPAQERSKPRAR